MRPKAYVILQRAIEEGIARGWARAHKHVDNPPEDHVKAEVEAAIMGNICEVFTFDDEVTSDQG